MKDGFQFERWIGDKSYEVGFCLWVMGSQKDFKQIMNRFSSQMALTAVWEQGKGGYWGRGSIVQDDIMGAIAKLLGTGTSEISKSADFQ